MCTHEETVKSYWFDYKVEFSRQSVWHYILAAEENWLNNMFYAVPSIIHIPVKERI